MILKIAYKPSPPKKCPRISKDIYIYIYICGFMGPGPGSMGQWVPKGQWVHGPTLGSHGHPPWDPMGPPMGSHGPPHGIPWPPYKILIKMNTYKMPLKPVILRHGMPNPFKTSDFKAGAGAQAHAPLVFFLDFQFPV